MKEGVTGASRTARWLASATAALLVAGVVSAGVVGDRDPGSAVDVVSAAGGTAGTVDVPSPTTTTAAATVPPVTPASPPAVAQATTVPKAAAAVLAAIGTTAPPTTRPPDTSATKVAAPPTTATTATPSTSTTVPRRVTIDFVNDHPDAVVVTVNERRFDLAPGARLDDVDVALAANGNDIVEVVVAGTTCFVREAGALFQPGGSYLVGASAGRGMCGSVREPQLDVGPVQANGAPR